MLRVAICDDEPRDLEIIKEMTIDLLETLNIEYEIITYPCGTALLEETMSFDLLLLDIEMEGMDGIGIARKIRSYNQETKIIFISHSTNYLRIGYTVHADRYFVKPVDKEEFNYELTEVLKQHLVDHKFLLDPRISPFKIYIKDILYIDFCDRKTWIHQKDDALPTTLTIKEWISLLGYYHFSQNHKAYLINLNYIKEVKSNTILLKNDLELPLSRSYKTTFRNDYFIFLGEKV